MNSFNEKELYFINIT